jgi:hypothetical protein
MGPRLRSSSSRAATPRDGVDGCVADAHNMTPATTVNPRLRSITGADACLQESTAVVDYGRNEPSLQKFLILGGDLCFSEESAIHP